MQGQASSEFESRKEQLEQKIKALDEEWVSLTREVESLKQKRTILDLERRAKSLGETVEMLRKQKEDLKGQVLELGAGGEGQTAGQSQ